MGYISMKTRRRRGSKKAVPEAVAYETTEASNIGRIPNSTVLEWKSIDRLQADTDGRNPNGLAHQ